MSTDMRRSSSGFNPICAHPRNPWFKNFDPLETLKNLSAPIKNRNCLQSRDSEYSPSMTVKPFTSFFSSAILALFLLGGITSIQADHHEKLLRHVVSFKYKEGTTQEQIAKVEKAFAALKETIKEIKSFEKGTNNSPEGLNKGFKHCYLLTFHSEKDRGVYLIHPDHVKFGKSLGPVLEDVFVIDYWAQH